MFRKNAKSKSIVQPVVGSYQANRPSVFRLNLATGLPLSARLTLSACGCDAEAEALVKKLVEKHREHTIINSILAPIVRAGIALARKEPAQAIEHLEVVAPYELGFAAVLAPIYLRARSYLMLGFANKAAKEFQRLLDHRGSEPFSPFYAVARLGLARAHARAKEFAKSAAAYESFLADWDNANSNIPVLLEARQESAQQVANLC